ncbi:hypothetical protein X474_27025 [Dethiosulfatarculus sandiegensis]|uniref:Uncharacterized protein n=1 Tax=Dethiosulfatarculus sandiegensis TaxID=1429043 RepID=A0A0D2JNG3_9BACT|nr:hypothetical protein X474_27025 [Dethiosulfatarculus sandiegensis]
MNSFLASVLGGFAENERQRVIFNFCNLFRGKARP